METSWSCPVLERSGLAVHTKINCVMILREPFSTLKANSVNASNVLLGNVCYWSAENTSIQFYIDR